MNAGDLSDIVTAIVAVASLGLSIYNFYVSQQDKRPVLVAKISNGFLIFGPEISDLMLRLEVANSGEKQVTVLAVEVAWGRQKAFFPSIDGTKRIPFELSPSESATFWIPMKDFKVSLRQQGIVGKVRVRACFRDAVGNEYYSRRRFTIDTNESAK
jgi:hypothetical protein